LALKAPPGVSARLTKTQLIEEIEELRRQVAVLEDAALERDTRHATVADLSQDLIWILTDDVIVDCNEYAVKALGWEKQEDLIGKSVFSLVHPDDQEMARQRVAQLHSGVPTPSREIRLLRSEGSTIFVETKACPYAYCGKPSVLAIARDITEAKRREKQLRESEERFRGIIENSPAAIFLKDLEGRFQVVSSKFEDWYGISAADLVGKKSHDIYPREFADKYAAQDREVIETEATCERETNIPFADGTERAIVMTKFPVRDGNGKIVGIGAFNSDVTAYREAEERLRQAQKMEAVGQLTGEFAHDFNNLLTVILGNLDLIEGVVERGSRESDMVVRSIRAAERGAELTDRLLAFSRKQTLLPRVTDVEALVAGMRELLDRSLGELVELHIAVPRECLWPCYVDPSQLESALLNMSINARDAMPNGGRLAIETANAYFSAEEPETGVDIGPGEYVMLRVADTGCGMSRDILDRAFEPFFTTKDVGKGTGLGLSMVYGFAKQSGGDVKIISQPGGGTVVTLYLPRATDDMADSSGEWRA
jgi:PAS domain S-box-containing protein